MFTRLLKSEAALRTASWVLGAYLSFALRTTRWTIEGEAHLAPFVADRGVVVAFWHECLPLIPALLAHTRRGNPGRRATMLVSRHRDGRVIAAALKSLAIATVHGSSARPDRANRDKGGAPGLLALRAKLATGDAIAITPDGPRGPRRVAAGGAAQLAALTSAPILPVAAFTGFGIRLRTWDCMQIPLPFGRGKIVCMAPITVPRDGQARAAPLLANALNMAAELAGMPP